MCLPTPLTNNKPDLSHIKNVGKYKKFYKKGQLIILRAQLIQGVQSEIFRSIAKKI